MSSDASIIIRLTKKEKAILQKLSLLEGKNMTNYIKSKIFDVQEFSDKFPKEETKKQSETHSEKVNDTSSKMDVTHIEKYLESILKTALINNGILRLTIGKDISLEEKESLKDDVNEKVAKFINVK